MNYQEACRLSTEIYMEDGRRSELLRAKCRWEKMTPACVLIEYGDPVSWPGYDKGGERP